MSGNMTMQTRTSSSQTGENNAKLILEYEFEVGKAYLEWIDHRKKARKLLIKNWSWIGAQTVPFLSLKLNFLDCFIVELNNRAISAIFRNPGTHKRALQSATWAYNLVVRTSSTP